MTVDELHAQLEVFFLTVRSWEARVNEWSSEAVRTQSLPALPEPGSEMALDSDEMPFYFPAVWNSIVQAIDHLGTVVDLVERGSQMRTFSYPSLFRSALLGLSEAVWLMGPADRGTRTNRARILSVEELRNIVAFMGDMPTDPNRSVDEMRRRLREDSGDLKSRGVTEKYEATRVIRLAGSHAQELLASPESLGLQLLFHWRTMSAQAHGRTWDKQYRAGYERGSYVGNTRMSTSMGSFETLREWFAVTLTLGLAAWTLFDDGRRMAPA